MALTALVLTDGVAGHNRSTLGILRALGELHDVRDAWLGVREARRMSRRTARMLAQVVEPHRFLGERWRIAPERVGAFAARRLDGWPSQADVVVSTGASTAAANIAVARALGAKNIYCGFTRWPGGGFDLLLTPVRERGRNVVTFPRPCEIDARALTPPRPLADAARRVALLLGGDSEHLRFTERDFDVLAERLIAVARARPRWTFEVFDSRRTPQALYRAFEAQLAAALPNATFHPFATGGLLSNNAAFHADCVLVTSDSMSMISEAVHAGRPTLAISPDGYAPPKRDADEIGALVEEGYLRVARFGEVDLSALAGLPIPPRRSIVQELSTLLAARGF